MASAGESSSASGAELSASLASLGIQDRHGQASDTNAPSFKPLLRSISSSDSKSLLDAITKGGSELNLCIEKLGQDLGLDQSKLEQISALAHQLNKSKQQVQESKAHFQKLAQDRAQKQKRYSYLQQQQGIKVPNDQPNNDSFAIDYKAHREGHGPQGGFGEGFSSLSPQQRAAHKAAEEKQRALKAYQEAQEQNNSATAPAPASAQAPASASGQNQGPANGQGQSQGQGQVSGQGQGQGQGALDETVELGLHEDELEPKAGTFDGHKKIDLNSKLDYRNQQEDLRVIRTGGVEFKSSVLTPVPDPFKAEALRKYDQDYELYVGLVPKIKEYFNNDLALNCLKQGFTKDPEPEGHQVQSYSDGLSQITMRISGIEQIRHNIKHGLPINGPAQGANSAPNLAPNGQVQEGGAFALNNQGAHGYDVNDARHMGAQLVGSGVSLSNNDKSVDVQSSAPAQAIPDTATAPAVEPMSSTKPSDNKDEADPSRIMALDSAQALKQGQDDRALAHSQEQAQNPVSEQGLASEQGQTVASGQEQAVQSNQAPAQDQAPAPVPAQDQDSKLALVGGEAMAPATNLNANGSDMQTSAQGQDNAKANPSPVSGEGDSAFAPQNPTTSSLTVSLDNTPNFEPKSLSDNANKSLDAIALDLGKTEGYGDEVDIDDIMGSSFAQGQDLEVLDITSVAQAKVDKDLAAVSESKEVSSNASLVNNPSSNSDALAKQDGCASTSKVVASDEDLPPWSLGEDDKRVFVDPNKLNELPLEGDINSAKGSVGSLQKNQGNEQGELATASASASANTSASAHQVPVASTNEDRGCGANGSMVVGKEQVTNSTQSMSLNTPAVDNLITSPQSGIKRIDGSHDIAAENNKVQEASKSLNDLQNSILNAHSTEEKEAFQKQELDLALNFLDSFDNKLNKEKELSMVNGPSPWDLVGEAVVITESNKKVKISPAEPIKLTKRSDNNLLADGDPNSGSKGKDLSHLFLDPLQVRDDGFIITQTASDFINSVAQAQAYEQQAKLEHEQDLAQLNNYKQQMLAKGYVFHEYTTNMLSLLAYNNSAYEQLYKERLATEGQAQPNNCIFGQGAFTIAGQNLPWPQLIKLAPKVTIEACTKLSSNPAPSSAQSAAPAPASGMGQAPAQGQGQAYSQGQNCAHAQNQAQGQYPSYGQGQAPVPMQGQDQAFGQNQAQAQAYGQGQSPAINHSQWNAQASGQANNYGQAAQAQAQAQGQGQFPANGQAYGANAVGAQGAAYYQNNAPMTNPNQGQSYQGQGFNHNNGQPQQGAMNNGAYYHPAQANSIDNLERPDYIAENDDFYNSNENFDSSYSSEPPSYFPMDRDDYDGDISEDYNANYNLAVADYNNAPPLVDAEPIEGTDRVIGTALRKVENFPGLRLMSEDDFYTKVVEQDEWLQVITKAFSNKGPEYSILTRTERIVDAQDPSHWTIVVAQADECDYLLPTIEKELNAATGLQLKLDVQKENDTPKGAPFYKAYFAYQEAIAVTRQKMRKVHGLNTLIKNLGLSLDNIDIKLYAERQEKPQSKAITSVPLI